MKLNLENVTCKCKKRATKVCLDHRVYFCEAESEIHPCSTMELEGYVKKMKTKKAELLNSLISLSKDNKKNYDKFEKIRESNISSLKDLRNSIVKNIDQLIDNYSEKLVGLMKAEFINRTEEIEKQLKELDTKGKYLEIDVFIDRNKYHVVKHRNKEIAQNFETYFTSESLRTDFAEILKVMNSQTAEINKYVQTLKISSSDDFDDIKADAFKYISGIFINENKHFIQNPNTIFNSIVDAKNVKMEYTQSDKQIMNDTMLLTNNDFGGLNKNNTTKKRGTDLVDTSIITQMQLNNDKSSPFNVNTMELEADFDIVDEEEELMNNELIDEDDIELEDEEEQLTEHTYKQEIQNKYENSKERLNRLLDRVLYDMNCPGFFDKNHKSDLNGYVKKFIEVLQMVLQELLVNFNKL